MKITWSDFGSRINEGSGIGELMDDLGHALAEGGEHMLMLGGGNPSHIPAVEDMWRMRLGAIAEDPDAMRRMLGNYDPPQGNPRFLAALADMLRREYGWEIGPENIAVTSGGQTAFYCLFNLLAGVKDGKPKRKILLPVVPEYIGYANQGMHPGLFRAMLPRITETGAHAFRYHVDFERLSVDDDIAAICVSRPTNPSGNVLDDAEVKHLSDLAASHGIPLIIDNAYGHPFPGIIFTEATPQWAPHHILVMSLSKLGLPGTRTGIIVASPEIVRAVASMTAVMGLANGNVGQAIVRPMLENGELLRMSRKIIRPYYERKHAEAREAAEALFPKESGYALHETGGALFLWLWLRGSRVASREFYERLKKRGVLVVPGDYFFYGLEENPVGEEWSHRHQCLRISYAMPHETVEKGLQIIAEEIRAAC